MGKKEPMKDPVETISQFEAIVLTAVFTLGEKRAYGLRIREEAKRLSIRGKLSSIAGIHAALDNLEDKGLVTSSTSSEGRPGRPRKYFKLEGAGQAVLDKTLRKSREQLTTLERALGTLRRVIA
jgi:DNA-binding PadR family transcriptional regulator